MTIYGPSPIIGSDNKFHYVYRITNIVEQKHYYGVRSSKISPFDDLGKKYFSSAKRNSWIIENQQQNPNNYKYKIIRTFATRKEASEFECLMHEKFNVANSDKFYNAVNQGSPNFNSAGKVSVRDINGNTLQVPLTDERYLDGTLQSVNKGKVMVKDNVGNIYSVSVNDPRYLDGTLVPIATGNVPVRDSEGKFFNVSVDDPRFTSGQLQSSLKGTKSIHNLELNKIARLKPGESLPEGWEYGQRSPGFKHYKKTPWGIFESLYALEPEICYGKLFAWCGNRNERPVNIFSYNHCKKLQETFGPDCIGKTYKELGFGLLTPEEYQQLIV